MSTVNICPSGRQEYKLAILHFATLAYTRLRMQELMGIRALVRVLLKGLALWSPQQTLLVPRCMVRDG